MRNGETQHQPFASPSKGHRTNGATKWAELSLWQLMPLQLLHLQRTKTDPCKNKQCMEEAVGKRELSAKVSL